GRGLGWRLAGLTLAAGELPVAGVNRSLRPAADQEVAVSANQANAHVGKIGCAMDRLAHEQGRVDSVRGVRVARCKVGLGMAKPPREMLSVLLRSGDGRVVPTNQQEEIGMQATMSSGDSILISLARSWGRASGVSRSSRFCSSSARKFSSP